MHHSEPVSVIMRLRCYDMSLLFISAALVQVNNSEGFEETTWLRALNLKYEYFF